MIESGGNAWQGGCHRARRRRPVLVSGSGTIGLLAGLFAKARGIEVHVLGIDRRTLDLAADLGADGAWTTADLPSLGFGAAMDASTSAVSAGVAVEVVEPGGRVVFVGIVAGPSTADSRRLAMKDLHAVAGCSPVRSGWPGRLMPMPLARSTPGR